jgi:hypothetical protein
MKKTGKKKIVEELAKAASHAHLARFYGRVVELMPPDAVVRVRDVLTEEELQAIWRDTAEGDPTTPRGPLMNMKLPRQ